MKHIPNATQKVTRQQLADILGVSEKTGRKEYKIIIDSLVLNRSYLTYMDLQTYGLLELNAV